MAILFLDSSALVKRYIPEAGSTWVKAVTDPVTGNRLHIARITGAEVVAAVTRRQRRGDITPGDASLALDAFRRDFPAAFPIVEIVPSLVARAMDLAEKHGLRGYDAVKHGLRGYDAVQLAAALDLRDQCRAAALPDPRVITADGDLNTAALAEGLTVDDPNSHP